MSVYTDAVDIDLPNDETKDDFRVFCLLRWLKVHMMEHFVQNHSTLESGDVCRFLVWWLADSNTEFRRSETCNQVIATICSESDQHDWRPLWICRTNPYGTVNSGSYWHFPSGPDTDYSPAEGPGWTCFNHCSSHGNKRRMLRR